MVPFIGRYIMENGNKRYSWRLREELKEALMYIPDAYFMPLKASPTVETLAEIFTNNIVPLLQEYFYEDYEKIRLVLGDNRKSNPEEQFIVAKENDYAELFGDIEAGLDDGYSYEINDAAFGNIEAYRSI